MQARNRREVSAEGRFIHSKSLERSSRCGEVSEVDDPDDINQLSPLHFSFFAFHLEHTFLSTAKPVHPNIVQYLAVTDNCIYTELYIGSLERILPLTSSHPSWSECHSFAAPLLIFTG